MELDDLPPRYRDQARRQLGLPSPAKNATKTLAAAGESPLETAMRIQLTAEAPGFVEQHRFIAGRRFAFDFAWPARKVALEVEGGTWSDGRHVRGQGYEDDCWKYSRAAIDGWVVVRATGAMVTDGRALTLVQQALEARPC